MIKINELRDVHNHIRHMERRMHRIKTLHSLGKLNTKETAMQLRILEDELKQILKELPSTERHYYYYKRLYGHPVKPAGKLPKPLNRFG